MDKHCKVHGLSSHSLRRDGRVRCKACSVDAVDRRRKRLKLLAVEYLGGECSRCGYSKYVGALEFHHTDPSAKDFEIAKVMAWGRIKPELDKCELLCANCHREVHAMLRNA